MANCTLEDLGKEFLTHVKMLRERGSVGVLYLNDTQSRAKKLGAELGGDAVRLRALDDEHLIRVWAGP